MRKGAGWVDVTESRTKCSMGKLLTNCQERRGMNEGGVSEKRLEKDLEIF